MIFRLSKLRKKSINIIQVASVRKNMFLQTKLALPCVWENHAPLIFYALGYRRINTNLIQESSSSTLSANILLCYFFLLNTDFSLQKKTDLLFLSSLYMDHTVNVNLPHKNTSYVGKTGKREKPSFYASYIIIICE